MGAMEFKSEKEIFDAIAQKVSKVTGVQLGERQESLVYSRLSKHLRNKGGLTAQEYWDYLTNNEAEEFPLLISLLTTHHTYFFREKTHFDLLLKELPQLLSQIQKQNRKIVRIWCAASSRGQEGYSIAMFLDYHLKQLAPQFDYHILFSDVDQESVKFSREGVYPNQELVKIPLNYRSNHWQRSTDFKNDTSQVKANLLKNCDFRVINLLHLHRLVLKEKFDIIFCRNVFIYFTPKEVERTTIHLLSHLEDHGYLVIGVSESLLNLKVPLKLLANSIYRKRTEAAPSVSLAPVHSPAPPRHKLPSPRSSESTTSDLHVKTSDCATLLILQRRLTIGFHFRKLIQDLSDYRSVGFEVIANAGDALALIRERKPDILIVDGSALSFLKDIRAHCALPVLLIKSDSEPEPELEYWEKEPHFRLLQKPFRDAAPGQLELIKKCLQELKTSSAVTLPRISVPLDKRFDANLLIAIGASTGGTEALSKIISQLPAGMPPIVIVQHIPEGFSRNFATRLDQNSPLSVREAQDGEMIQSGDVLIAPGNLHLEILGRPGHFRSRVFAADKVNGHRPSVDVLFRSVARSAGAKAIGTILTGMGSDGAEGLLTIRQKGGRTFGQDEASCIVYGMPKVAHQLGAVERVVSLPLVATELIKASLLKKAEDP